jgi:hypothetical protein
MGGCVRPVSGQRLGGRVPAVTITYAMEKTGCCQRGPRREIEEKRTGQSVQLSSAREADKSSARANEAEEPLLLESVAVNCGNQR